VLSGKPSARQNTDGPEQNSGNGTDGLTVSFFENRKFSCGFSSSLSIGHGTDPVWPRADNNIPDAAARASFQRRPCLVRAKNKHRADKINTRNIITALVRSFFICECYSVQEWLVRANIYHVVAKFVLFFATPDPTVRQTSGSLRASGRYRMDVTRRRPPSTTIWNRTGPRVQFWHCYPRSV